MNGMTTYEIHMLDKPSVIPEDPVCVVCGRWGATNKHHVIQKGMGGRPAALEKRIPLWRLCGNGNIDGCHGKFHKGMLHARWNDGWEVKETDEPVSHWEAWQSEDGWRPLAVEPEPVVFGRKS